MSGATDAPRLVPTRLAVTAARWSPAEYSDWFRTGLDTWFHPETTPGLRAVSFRPVILDPDIDLVAPVADAVETVPGGRERLRGAISEALAIWTDDSSHSGKVLEALLYFAQRLPSAPLVPGLRRLVFDGRLNNQSEKELLALRVLETAMKLVALPEGEALLRDIRELAWQPSFAATWLEGMARAGKVDWFEGLRDLRDDLEALDPTGESLRPVLRRMTNRTERPAALIEQLRSLDIIDDWLEKVLFDGDRPAMSFDKVDFADTKGAAIPAVTVGKTMVPLDGGRSRIDPLLRIANRRLFPPPPSRTRPRPVDDLEQRMVSILSTDTLLQTRH